MFFGIICDLRVNVAAVYVANFTPSTVPLTAVPGTSLLTCQSNTFVDNSTNNDVVNKLTQLSSKSFYKLLLSNEIGMADSIDTVNNIKTWTDIKTLLTTPEAGKDIQMYLDIGYSPITGDDSLASYESFKITVNN